MNISNIYQITLSNDTSYVGKEIFIMLQIEKYELMLKTNMDAIRAFNKMHTNIYFLRLSFKVM
jgi:hypothetical protein